MNPDSQGFEDLRRLLALKRHEQPPPGYFQDFSREVILRIRAGEQAPDKAPWFLTAWLQRFWFALETKPALAGALGAGLCAGLLWVVVSTENLGAAGAVIPNPELSGGIEIRPQNQSTILGLASFSSTNGIPSGRLLPLDGWAKGSFLKYNEN